jgi:hypothetical protein
MKLINFFSSETFHYCLACIFLMSPTQSQSQPQPQPRDSNTRECARLGLLEGSGDYVSCIKARKESSKTLGINKEKKSQISEIMSDSNLIALWSNDCIFKKHTFSFYEDDDSIFLVTKDAGITQYEGLVIHAELYTKKIVKLRIKITTSNVGTIREGAVSNIIYELLDQRSLLLVESFRDEVYSVKDAINISTGKKVPPWNRCI